MVAEHGWWQIFKSIVGQGVIHFYQITETHKRICSFVYPWKNYDSKIPAGTYPF